MMNPVWKKEMQVSARSWKFAMGLFLFNAVLALIGIAVFSSFSYYGQNPAEYYEGILFYYNVILLLEAGMICFIVPATTAGAISGERERQTLEILLTTTMKPWQIIYGKLMASISTILLYVFSSLPMVSLVFVIGGLHIKDVCCSLLYLSVMSVYLGGIGIFFSTKLKKSISATVCTYGVMVITNFIVYFLALGYVVVQSLLGNTSWDCIELGICTGFGMLSPLNSIFAMIDMQYKGNSELLNSFVLIGDSTGWEELSPATWWVLSMIVQIAVAGLALFLASRRLYPMKKKKYK